MCMGIYIYIVDKTTRRAKSRGDFKRVRVRGVCRKGAGRALLRRGGDRCVINELSARRGVPPRCAAPVRGF